MSSREMFVKGELDNFYEEFKKHLWFSIALVRN